MAARRRPPRPWRGRVIEHLSRPFLIEGHQAIIGVSIGAAPLRPGEADADLALRRADIALYESKRLGRGQMHWFEDHMARALDTRRLVEGELRRAILLEQFELHYQPQYRFGDAAVRGFEALVRWNHPERGQISPAAFIKISEETGLIVDLGDWIMRAACAEAATWPGDLAIAVNVSPVEFEAPGYVARLTDILAETGLDPARLEIEITETVILRNAEKAAARMRALQAMGIRISLDDFGTGYSSLTYLRDLPFDKVKIDQSFVQGRPGDIIDVKIVGAVADLGGALLGMEVLAEGRRDRRAAQPRPGRRLHLGAGLLHRPADGRRGGGRVPGRAPARGGPGPGPRARTPSERRGTSMSDAMVRLVYFSRNVIEGIAPGDPRGLDWEIDRILEVSQARNAACGVTGALIYNGGVFGQVLEGPEAAVEATYDRIQSDDRHVETTVLDYAPIAARAFGDWSMGFVGTATPRSGPRLTTSLAEMDGAAIFGLLHRLALKNELRRRAA